MLFIYFRNTSGVTVLRKAGEFSVPSQDGVVRRDLEDVEVFIPPLDLLLVSDPSGASGEGGIGGLGFI